MPTDYRWRTKAQFDVLEQEARTQRSKLDIVVAGVKPVLDCVDLEVAPQPDDRPPHTDIVIEMCKMAWERFNHDAVVTAATHALTVVRSHYLATDLQAIGGRFAEGRSEVETQQLEDEVEDTAKKLASDIDLFGEMDSNSRAQ